MKVIAECGCNWRSLEEAFRMIEKASEVGCWAAKFQAFSKEYCWDNNLPVYLSLDYIDVKGLFGYGKKVGIEVFFTPFDVERVQWCEDIGVSLYKIRFADKNDLDIGQSIAKKDKNYLISCQGWDDHVHWNINQETRLLCVPKYPASSFDYCQYNLGDFHGISDHTPDMKMYSHYLELFKDKPIWKKNFYWEKHVCLDKNCLEAEWSVTFEELAEVLHQ